MKSLKKVDYRKLNSRQQENFNFLKVSAVLADYGFNTLRLSDDWQGADFIAIHVDGKIFYKVQLKGALTLDKKYAGKDIWICFRYRNVWYLYPHDVIMKKWTKHSNYSNTVSWKVFGVARNPNPTKKDLEMLKEFAL